MRISDWSSDVCSSDLLAVCNVAKSPVELARMQEPIRHPSGVYPQHLHLARDQRRHLLARLGARGPVAIVAFSEGGLASTRALEQDRKSTRLNSSHSCAYRVPSSARQKNKTRRAPF